MSASNPLTPKLLVLQSANAFEARGKVENCANILAIVAAALFSIALITALQPLVKSAFSGVIRYDTATIVTIPVSGGLGLICMLAYLQRRCAANQIEIPIEPKNVEIVQNFTAAYDPSYGLQESFTLALNPDNGLRRDSIISRPRNEYKHLVLRVYRDHYNVQTGQCGDPLLIEDLRLHPAFTAVRDELANIVHSGFLQLLA